MTAAIPAPARRRRPPSRPPGSSRRYGSELLADDAQTASRLASEFDLNQLVIADVVRQVQHSGVGVPGLWAACRAQTRPRLDTLARRIEPVARWDDLVLPDAELTLLHHIVDQVRGRATVLRHWGLAERVTRGSAVTALFAGGSGTGKTLAAEVIAHELDLDMYRIDLAGVVSKYIGETEQQPPARVRRGRGGRGAADVRRGRRAVRQAQRGQGQPRPLRQYRGQLPAGADGGLPRGGDPGHQPAARAGRRVPAPVALHRPFPFPCARRAGEAVGAGVPRPGAGRRAGYRSPGQARRERRDDP